MCNPAAQAGFGYGSCDDSFVNRDFGGWNVARFEECDWEMAQSRNVVKNSVSTSPIFDIFSPTRTL